MKEYKEKESNVLIYKYYSPTEYNLDALINQYFWFSKREFLNDPFDLGNFKRGRRILTLFKLLAQQYGYQSNIENNKPISKALDYASCSFTETGYNKQMWAYYAKDYTGWCLVFNENVKILPLYPVIYVDKYLQPHSKCTSSLRYYPDALTKVLCTKHESWIHEEELRMLFELKGGKDGIALNWNAQMLEQIIVGYNIKPAYLSILRKIANDMHVPIYKIGLSSKDFTLTKRKL